jgi:hypothetical protein
MTFPEIRDPLFRIMLKGKKAGGEAGGPHRP